MLFASESLATATGGIDVGNLEFWVVLTNMAIVVATLMLTKVTAKDAMLHEEKMVDKATETTKDLTEIVHDVLIQEGRIIAEHNHEHHKDERPAAEAAPPIRAVK